MNIKDSMDKKYAETFVACPKCGGTILERKKYFRAHKDTVTGRAVEHHSIDMYICTNCTAPIIEKEPSEAIRKSILGELWPTISLKDLIFIEKKINLEQFVDLGRKILNRPSLGKLIEKGLGLNKLKTSQPPEEIKNDSDTDTE